MEDHFSVVHHNFQMIYLSLYKGRGKTERDREQGGVGNANSAVNNDEETLVAKGLLCLS